MLSPYRKVSQKNPLTANTHFSDGDPFSRMNKMNKASVCSAAMLNCATAAHVPIPRNAVQRLRPPSRSNTAQATMNGNGRARHVHKKICSWPEDYHSTRPRGRPANEKAQIG
jgi:hypothetical protein